MMKKMMNIEQISMAATSNESGLSVYWAIGNRTDQKPYDDEDDDNDDDDDDGGDDDHDADDD